MLTDILQWLFITAAVGFVIVADHRASKLEERVDELEGELKNKVKFSKRDGA